jgi:hypothetical protein
MDVEDFAASIVLTMGGDSQLVYFVKLKCESMWMVS